LTLVALVAGAAHADYREYLAVPVDPALAQHLQAVAAATLHDFPQLRPADLALSAVDLTDAAHPVRADVQGDAPFYPASVIKLFYMVDIYLHHQETLPDVPRALRAMIGISDNDAAAFLLDVATGTSSGPELDGWRLRRFLDDRAVINRDLARLGYDVSAMCKPWSFGPFGRDVQALGPHRERRNRASANTVAALLLWIVRGEAVSPAASAAMRDLLARQIPEPPEVPPEQDQVKAFLGAGLPAGTHLFSKAGWTDEVRHDAAYVTLADGRKLILVVFTRGEAVAGDTKLLPAIAKRLVAPR
jgi:hypothetical protein